MKEITLMAQMLFAFCIPGCGQNGFDQQLRLLYKKTVPLIQPSELAGELHQNKKIVLLDTRTAKEYAVSHLPKARFVGYDSFTLDNLKDIKPDTPIIVYCAVGVRSERIGEKLLQAGFTQVRNLYGGIFQWKNKGYSLVDAENTPTNRVHAYNRYWGTWLTRGVKVYE